MAEESEKVEKTATEHEQDLIKHGMEVSLPEAEARAEEQRKIQEKAAEAILGPETKAHIEGELNKLEAEEKKRQEAEATGKRQAALLFDYFEANAEKKELDKKLEELKKLVHLEMDVISKNVLRAEPYVAMRTQQSKSTLDQDLLKQKVDKAILEACQKSTTFWVLKVGKEE